MDLLNKTNRAQIHGICKKAKYRKFLSFLSKFFLNKKIYGRLKQMHNFSSISPKLRQLGPKTQEHGV